MEDKKYHASIQFKGYTVRQLRFEKCEDFSGTDGPIELNFQLSHRIDINEQVQAVQVTLACELFPGRDGEKRPFRLYVELIGSFMYEADMDRPQLRNLLLENTVAILFPYLRTTVTAATTAANVVPVILPTINVAAMLERRPDEIQTQLDPPQ